MTALGDHFRSRPYNPEDSPAVTAYYQGIEAVLNYLYQRVIAQEAESLESNKPVLAESVRERYRRQPRLRFDS